MQLVIVAVGKLKEHYWRDAEKEYVKRLLPHASVTVEEVMDEPEGGGVERIKLAEATRILQRFRERDYIVALDVLGKRMTSEFFSKQMQQMQSAGYGRYVFVIGGSFGLHSTVIVKANVRLSFSDFTFPHQMMRVILLEQLYRSFRILTGAPYHK